MARVRPFRAWRYGHTERDISALVAPPYDVVSPEMNAELLMRNPHNAVALELPEGPLDPGAEGNRYSTGAARWAEWKADGTLQQDPLDSLYLVEQRFELSGRPYTRRALFAAVGLEPFEAGVVLPHERTLPKALGDRFQLIRATAANFSPVFALFDDPEHRVDALLGTTLASEPDAEARGDDGVLSVLWHIEDPELIAAITAEFDDKRLFIADGHHRYTTALAYRDERAEAAGGLDVDAPWASVMMALVNMDDPELLVLPTHRVADAPGDFDADTFVARMSETFEITDLPPGHPAGALDTLERPGFLLHVRGWEFPKLAQLRQGTDLDRAIPLDRSAAWKTLDVAVLQELALDPLLDIHPDRPETLERLFFVKDAHEALQQVGSGAHDVAFVLRATGVDEMREVALAGETMPQKSTYFYPKLLSGLLYRDLG